MFENLTIGQLATSITTIGIICGFLYKIFIVFTQVNENKTDINRLETEIGKVRLEYEKQKEDILSTVEESNGAINLICMGVSALIDNALNENTDKTSLRSIKQKLDERKEIV